MVSIVEQFAGRKGKQMPQPAMPPFPRPASPKTLHPAAQEAAAVYSQALDQVEQLQHELDRARNEYREETMQLKADLQVEQRHLAEVKKILAEDRGQLEVYRRYAERIRSELEHVAAAAVKANDIAMQISDKLPAGEKPATIDVASTAGTAAVEGALSPPATPATPSEGSGSV